MFAIYPEGEEKPTVFLMHELFEDQILRKLTIRWLERNEFT